jgi:hypothetical protein
MASARSAVETNYIIDWHIASGTAVNFVRCAVNAAR